MLCVVGIAGCSSSPANSPQPPGSLPPTTAQMTVNGKSEGTTRAVRCEQDGWAHTVTIGTEESGATFVVNTGGKITAQRVDITNVGGFTGSFYADHIGKAEASVAGTTFRVNGTVEGATTEDPNKRTTANFDIKANC